MADTYSTRLRTRLQETNANKNTWGAYLNTGALQLLDDSIAGWANVDLSSTDKTLTTGNGAADEARMAVIRAYGSGTTTRTITIPSVEKCYKVKNEYGGLVLVKTAAGVGVTILPGQWAEVWCNGTECYRSGVSGWGVLSTTSLTSGTSSSTSFAVTGQKFSKLRIRLRSLTAGATPTFSFSLTGAAGTTTSITLLATAGSEVTGGIEIENYSADGGIGSFSAYSSVTNPHLASGTNGNFAWNNVGGLTSFTLASSNAFTAGTVMVSLR